MHPEKTTRIKLARRNQAILFISPPLKNHSLSIIYQKIFR